MQKLMFPKIDNDENILFAKNVPSLEVSGDFYNFKNIGDKIFMIYMQSLIIFHIKKMSKD